MNAQNEIEKQGTILIVEDDEDDLMLTQEALAESPITVGVQSVKDGEELMDYLHYRRRYARRGQAPRPDLILLDLKMPKKDGIEALREIRSDPELRVIPVVILTTSRVEEDIQISYELGANSYIVKSDGFRVLVEALEVLKRYWFNMVLLPSSSPQG